MQRLVVAVHIQDVSHSAGRFASLAFQHLDFGVARHALDFLQHADQGGLHRLRRVFVRDVGTLAATPFYQVFGGQPVHGVLGSNTTYRKYFRQLLLGWHLRTIVDSAIQDSGFEQVVESEVQWGRGVLLQGLQLDFTEQVCEGVYGGWLTGLNFIILCPSISFAVIVSVTFVAGCLMSAE